MAEAPATQSLRVTQARGHPSAVAVHAGAPALALGHDGIDDLKVHLTWESTARLVRPIRLRITIARDLWGTSDLVAHGRRGEIGRVMLDHVDAFEHVDMVLRPCDPPEIDDGIVLSIDGPETVDVFGLGAGEGGFFSPRLFNVEAHPSRPMQRLLDGIASPASLQPFGWKLGCVLDGLLDLAAGSGESRFLHRARAHLAEFFDVDGLSYQDPWGRPVRGSIYGIEGLLPLAALARLGEVERARVMCDDFLPTFRRADGALSDHGMLSTEGMYTVAYPLALIGALAGREAFLTDAALQLRARVRELRDGGILLRHYEDGRVEFRDWLRAWTWYLLGLARTVPVLAEAGLEVGDLRAELGEIAEASLRWRGADGLWHTYVDDPRTPLETSGSAGIAAAWAIGARDGLLDPSWSDRARETANGLFPYVAAEGVVSGASQANKGGERLQRSRYRVNSQVGTGLLAQLVAALPDPVI